MKHTLWIFLVTTIFAAVAAAGPACSLAASQGSISPNGEGGTELSAAKAEDPHLLVTSQDSAYELLAATLVLEAGLRDAKIEALAETADHLKTVESFRTALVKDIETAGKAGFSLVRSHTLEQFGRFGVRKMPEIIAHLKKTKKLKESFAVPDLTWAGDLIDAIHEDIQTTGEGSSWVFVKSHTLEEIGKIGLKGMPAAVNWLRESKRVSKNFNVPDLGWTAEFFKAVGQDIEESGAGGFVLWRSHTLEQSARILLDKTPVMVAALQKSGKLPTSFSLPFLSGAADIATASGKYLGSGHADLETTTMFWDGVNKTMWSIAGSLWGGEKGAEVSQAFGDAAAKLTRGLSQPVFNKAVLLGSGQAQKLFADWQTLQRKRVQLGLPVQSMKEMYGEDLLRKNGFSGHAIRAMAASFADEAIRGAKGAHSARTSATAEPAVANKNNNPVLKNHDDVFPQPQHHFIWFFLPPPSPPPGGVDITPEPLLAGKADGNATESALSARPSSESLSWEVPPTGQK